MQIYIAKTHSNIQGFSVFTYPDQFATNKDEDDRNSHLIQSDSECDSAIEDRPVKVPGSQQVQFAEGDTQRAHEAAHLSLRARHSASQDGELATQVGGGLTHTYPPNANQRGAVQQVRQPKGTFGYLPDSYCKPVIHRTENREANEIGEAVKEIFTSQALALRRRVDNHLREFKKAIDETPSSPLPACFDSWKKMAFQEWEDLPDDGPFHVEYSRYNTGGRQDRDPMINIIYVNKKQTLLTPEALKVNTSMETLLDTCHELLDNAEWTKQQIFDQNEQLSKISDSKTTEKLLEQLQSLSSELDQFAEDVCVLLNDIESAVSPYMSGTKARSGDTGTHINLNGKQCVSYHK